MPIAIPKQFVETIFADQEFRVYGVLKFRELSFRELLGIRENHEILRLENLDIYSILEGAKEHFEPFGVLGTYFLAVTCYG